jgi:translocation and assembly module TamB
MKAAEPQPRRRRPWGLWALGVVAGLLSLLLIAGVVVRYGAATDPGRAMIVSLANGLKLGPVGRLKIAGLKGDVFGAFTLAELEIIDAKGPWIRAEGVTMVWDPGELFARRLHIGRLWAKDLRVLRQPILTKEPAQPPSERPVTVLLDDVRLRLDTSPAFSVQRGLWEVKGRAILRRNGEARAEVSAHSLLHKGDGLELSADIGRKDQMHLRAEGMEAAGGALAGALGLPADRRLLIHAKGDATQVQGQIVARVQSGADTPLDFTADWSKAGADVKGHVDLAASKITHYFAERLGAQAQVALSVKPDHGDLYRAKGQLTAPQGQIAIDGPVNWKTWRAVDTGVVLTVTDLSKWLSIPKIGPTRVDGVFNGGIDNFVLKGRLAGDRLEQSGVSVAHVFGPATFTRAAGEWRIQGDLQGSGAAGASPIGPLLGPNPHVMLDISILKDNRFLIRSLDLRGSGVTVLAQGGQGLFGELSFKGDMRISNLTPIHPGAHGQVSATWDASIPKGGHVWALSFDAKGANFATGLSELDRYLGAQPHLFAKGSWGEGRLAFDRVELAGGALQASGKGVLGEKESIAADIDWTAKGPFAAGPVEIAGTAKGTGRIGGALSNPRADLVAELASVDFGRLVITPAKLTLTLLKGPDGLDGLGALEGPTAKYGHASLKTAFRFVGPGIELTDLVADAGGVKLSGALALRNGAPSTADLKLVAGPGAFLNSGKLNGVVKLVEQGGATQANIALDGDGLNAPDLPVQLRTLHLKANGPLARLPFQAGLDSVAPIAWSFKGEGIYAGGKETVVTLTGGGKLRKAPYSTQSPAEIRFGPGSQSAKLHLAIAGGRADVDGRLTPEGATARAELSGVGLGAVAEDFTGTVSGSLSLQGKGPRLEGMADLSLDGARSRDEPANEALNAKIKAVLAANRIHLVANAANPEGLKSALDVDLPAEASAAPFRIAIDRTKSLKGAFTAEGEIRPLWDLIAGGERTLSGQVSVHAALGGSLADPAATGDATLVKGQFRDVGTGLALKDLAVNSSFNHTVVTVSRFSGVDSRGGSLTGEGRVSLDRGGASTFTLTARKFQLIDNDIGRASASGQATLVRDADGKARLTGALTIDRAEFAANTPVPTGVVPMDVVELHVPEKEGVERPQGAQTGAAPVFALDVSLRAPRGIFLRGKGLEAEFSLDAHVGGFVSRPELTGVARVVRGSYDFAGQRFEIDDRGTVRLATTPEQIRLDLTATRDDPTLIAVVRVRGTAAKPEITLTSTPVLPQDEVLSRVLFGVSASQLSPGQSAQLVSSLAALQGGGGFDLIGNLRQFAGLDRLALGGNQASGTTISGGKYLTDNVYLELTGGGRTGPQAQVEWRVRRDLSIVSMVGTQGDARLSVRFRKDY